MIDVEVVIDQNEIEARIRREATRRVVERNVPILERAAADAIEIFGRGLTGQRKRKDAVRSAVKEAYRVDIGRRPTHHGGWADQSEHLSRYPRAAKVMTGMLRTQVRAHARPMKDSYVYELATVERTDGYSILFDLRNTAFYASFVEARGYSVTGHLGPEIEHLARGYGADV